MVYIYVKLVCGKPYYYLRISQRIKDRVIAKDIAYLGNDVTKVQLEIDKLPTKYKNHIRKSYHNIKRWIDTEYYLQKIQKLKLKANVFIKKDLLEQIEAIKLHFNTVFLKLDNQTITEVYKHFLIDFAFNTTSIEGNTITLKEASMLLKENRTPKDKSLRDIYDLQNTEKVFFYLFNKKPKFNQELIIKIHDMLLENIDIRKGYRTQNIKVFLSHFKTSPGKYIKIDMGILLKWYNQNKNKFHPLVLATLFHHKFEKIHPFADGNGRTGRILMNYMLLKRKYPPLIIQKKHRMEYLKSLSSADKSHLNGNQPKDFKNLIKYIADELIKSYWDNFNV